MGDSSTVPVEIKRWSWGAFGLNWIWGLGNETYIALLSLVPVVNLVMIFVLGFKGNEWAWRNKRWASVADFQRVQRKWSIAWFIYISVLVLIAVVAIIAAASGSQPKSTAAVDNATTASVETTIPIGQVELTNLQLKKSFIDYDLTGEATNNATVPVSDIDLTVEAYDCPGSAIDSSCTHIGETTAVLIVQGSMLGKIPPGQTREVEDSFVNLSGMPPVKGNFIWSYTVTNVTK